MMCLQARSPLPVTAHCPTLISPLSLMYLSDSSLIIGPPLSDIALATPLPCFNLEFAAFVMASEDSSVISACTTYTYRISPITPQ